MIRDTNEMSLYNCGVYSDDITNISNDNILNRPEILFNDVNDHSKFMYSRQVTIHKNARSLKNKIKYDNVKPLLMSSMRVINYENSIFPINTIKPKVQRDIFAPASQIPREVAVERKIREHSKYKIDELLKHAGIENYKLIPIKYIRDNTATTSLTYTKNKLNNFPLEWFDNRDYECMTILEWKNFGIIDGKQYPIPGYAFLPNPIGDFNNLITLFNWVMVSISSYRLETDLWTVTEIASNISYNIPRIYFYFIAENMENYIQRLKFAVHHRERCEKEMQYMLLIECMKLDTIRSMDLRKIKKVYELTFKDEKLRNDVSEKVKLNLFAEIEMDYRRTTCAIDFLQNAYLNTELKDLSFPECLRYTKVGATNIDCVTLKDTVKKALLKLKREIIYTTPEVSSAMIKIQFECLKVTEMNCFNFAISGNCNLKDYCDLQIKQRQSILNYLKG